MSDSPILTRVQTTGIDDSFRTDWSDAAYAATMPGNFDAYLFAVLGGLC